MAFRAASLLERHKMPLKFLLRSEAAKKESVKIRQWQHFYCTYQNSPNGINDCKNAHDNFNLIIMNLWYVYGIK